MHQLAIVIPAFKPDFFRASLSSIAVQTDRRFQLYVGDDGGPSAISEICSSFPDLDMKYCRFNDNLGSQSLTGHWNRCVALSGEPWVWLFADDDLMTPECVASFYQELENAGKTTLLRFDTDTIDAEGNTTAVNVRHPREESGIDFIFERLKGCRSSYVVEYIFRREAFDKNKGFASYPAGWCADDVTWFQFSDGEVIRTLENGRVKWRASGRNISEDHMLYRTEKLAAAHKFLQFVRSDVIPNDPDEERTTDDWQAASERWYQSQLRYFMPMGASFWFRAWRTTEEHWKANWLKRACLFTWWNVHLGATSLYRAAVKHLTQHR
ncbi:MAG: glycosyltransferase family 2 protein [Gemmatimonadetes bacterium]|nr:glycosyltransferase family 2 protein [Gemmatimonadota bacterium]